MDERTQAEKLRAKEDELRRRDRELRHRDASLKERLEEAEAVKAQCDAALVDLHRRDMVISDAEKKHGTLKRREDEVAAHEVHLTERENELHRLLQQAATHEQELARHREEHTRITESTRETLAMEREAVEKREAAVAAAEEALNRARQSYQSKISDDEGGLRRRERAVAESERRAGNVNRTLELKTLETHQVNEQASERLRGIKADHADLETKLREVKWREDALEEMLASARINKLKITKWEAEVRRRESAVLLSEAEATETKAELTTRAEQLEVRVHKVVHAEQDLRAREAAVAAREEVVEKRLAAAVSAEAACDTKQANLEKLERSLRKQQRRLDEEAQAAEDRDAALLDREKTASSRERAIKAWILELEFRHRAVERREWYPRPYLSDALEGNPDLLRFGSDSADRSHFNRALVAMELGDLQRAYLAASKATPALAVAAANTNTTSSAFRGSSASAATTRSRPASRVDTRPLQASDGASGVAPASGTAPAAPAAGSSRSMANNNSNTTQVEAVAMDTAASMEMDRLLAEFRDLVAGFALLDDDSLSSRFTQQEEDRVVEIVKADARLFDEWRFLHALQAVTMPRVRLSAAPQDAALVGATAAWVADRERLVDERLRRATQTRLQLLSDGCALLRGRVPPHRERLRALGLDRKKHGSDPTVFAEEPAVPTRHPPIPSHASLQAKLRNRVNTAASSLSSGPPRPEGKTSNNDEDLAPSWEGQQGSKAAASPSSSKGNSNINNNGRSPPNKAGQRIADALPPELRVYYE